MVWKHGSFCLPREFWGKHPIWLASFKCNSVRPIHFLFLRSEQFLQQINRTSIRFRISQESHGFKSWNKNTSIIFARIFSWFFLWARSLSYTYWWQFFTFFTSSHWSGRQAGQISVKSAVKHAAEHGSQGRGELQGFFWMGLQVGEKERRQ